jgi:hypothetical protein
MTGQQPERTWKDMGRRERFALVRESVADKPAEMVDRIMARVEAHFASRSTTDPTEVLNVALRETWREEHGDTVEWDRAERVLRNHQLLATLGLRPV